MSNLSRNEIVGFSPRYHSPHTAHIGCLHVGSPILQWSTHDQLHYLNFSNARPEINQGVSKLIQCRTERNRFFYHESRHDYGVHDQCCLLAVLELYWSFRLTISSQARH